jgi:hypothetical protein
MTLHNPPKDYEDMYLKIFQLVFKNDKFLITKPLQTLLIQKIACPLQQDLIRDRINITDKNNLLSLSNLLEKNNLLNKKKLNISSKKFLKHYFIGVAILFFSTLYFLVMPKVKLITKYNLIYGLSSEYIYRQSSKIECDKFFHKVNPKLYNSKFLTLIQLNSFNLKRKNKKNYKVVFYIPLYLLRAHGIAKFKLIKNLFERFQLWRSIYKKFSCAVILGAEIMLDSNPLIDLKKINSLSTTVSQWGIQPYFFHKLNRIPKNFFWYSNNSYPLLNKSSITEGDMSYLKLIKANHHIVWTDSFGMFIKKFVNIKYTILDFILFYLPKKQNYEKMYDIVIFDVTPQIKYDNFYYSLNNCTNFILDIFKAVEIISSSRDSLAIALKPKRKYIKSHVSEYVEFIKSWSHQGKFKLLDPDIDIFELISSARLVVVIPFSTPALIAKRLGVKSCYYNPDKRYRFKKFVDGVRVIKTVEEIVDFYNSK